MIRIAICDDEAVMCQNLKKMVSLKLEQWGEPFRITTYANALQLLCSPLDFDLIFLDIQMPGLDGVTLAKALRQKEFEGILIFVTILTECMLDAFEVEAMDYLCKPIDENRLDHALKRSLKRLGLKTEKHLFIQTMNWCKTVKLSDIYYCEVMNRKIFLHTKHGLIDYYGKMKEVEQKTAPYFIRCHRSFLINPDYLLEYINGQAILENGEQIPVSKNYHQAFMKRVIQDMDKEV
ncbi:MAG: response regulator transcription factor [Hungatella sp.]|nr:response regulator transcription factor [Hungatella sp.]